MAVPAYLRQQTKAKFIEIFFTMTAEEKDLIRGLLDSDKERRAAVP